MKGYVQISISFFVFVAGFVGLIGSIITEASVFLHSIAAITTALAVILFMNGIKKIRQESTKEKKATYKRRWIFILPIILVIGGVLIWTQFNPLPIGLEIIRYLTIVIIGAALGDFLDYSLRE